MEIATTKVVPTPGDETSFKALLTLSYGANLEWPVSSKAEGELQIVELLKGLDLEKATGEVDASNDG